MIAEKVDPAEADRESRNLELRMHIDIATLDKARIASDQQVIGSDTRTVAPTMV